MRQERFLTKCSFFVRSPHQRIARIPRAPKARAKKNWRFCGKYCAKFILKCGSRVRYSQILGSIPNSLFWHLHCTNPCTKFWPCALPSLVFCLLFFLFLQSKTVRCCEVQSCRVLNARLAPTNVGSHVPKRCVLITPREIFCYPQTKSNSISRAPEARARRNQASLHWHSL